MKIGSDQWIRMVLDGATRLNLEISAQQAAQFAMHAQWLMEWNRKINLTAITDSEEVGVKHFLDAVAPMAHIPDEGHLLDMGTGGGFPGIPLKIMRPAQPMTLIDSVRKKISFVKHVIRHLSLENIEALHTRAEDMVKPGSDRGKYDVVVCRALADVEGAVNLALPLLKPSGKIVLYQGPRKNMGVVPDKPERGQIFRQLYKCVCNECFPQLQ